MAVVAALAAVGWRVRVFWEGDDEWFEGTITKYVPENGYFVEYDDGEQQWETDDPARIQFLSRSDEKTQLILNAKAHADANEREDEAQGNKWSAQPPPSMTGYEDDDAYAQEEEEYEADHDHDEADEDDDVGKSGRAAGCPVPQDEAEDGEASDGKPSPQAAAPTRSLRDPTKFLKSGVFFRDSETLHETRRALLKEKHELAQQYEQLATSLAQKEDLSQSLKRELHGLKAQVTVASLKGASLLSGSTTDILRTSRDWAERVASQKTANRTARQQLSERHSQLMNRQKAIQQMEMQKHQLEAKLARVPRKELRSLIEIQVEIAQVTAEKRALEAQLAKSIPVERSTRSNGTTTTGCGAMSQNQRDAKTELETDLRQVEKHLLRVRDQINEWTLRRERELAKIVPVRARIERLQTELHAYEKSQVLLRSVFLRLDRTGDGVVSLDAALEVWTLLAGGKDQRSSKHELRALLPDATPASLDFTAFKICFQQIFPSS
jgi:hypothetical protein